MKLFIRFLVVGLVSLQLGAMELPQAPLSGKRGGSEEQEESERPSKLGRKEEKAPQEEIEPVEPTAVSKKAKTQESSPLQKFPPEIQQTIARFFAEEKGFAKDKLYKAAANIRNARLSYKALRDAIDDPQVTEYLIKKLSKYANKDLVEAVFVLHTKAATDWLHNELRNKNWDLRIEVVDHIIDAFFNKQPDVAEFLLNLAYSRADNMYLVNIDGRNDKHQTILMGIANSGNTKLLKKILVMNPILLLDDKYGQTALGYAVYNGNEENVDLLLAAGAQPIWHGHDGAIVGSALLNAAEANNFALVEKFLAFPDVIEEINFIRDSSPFHPLELAAKNNNYPMFQRLLQVPEVEINGAVLDAALRKNKQMVQDLLNLNVDPNDEESGGRFPIFGVFQVDRIGKPFNDDAAARDLIKLLIAHRTNMRVANDNGETPLIVAVQQSKLKTVEELLKSDAKATINSMDGDGHTALWYAQQLTTDNKDAIIKLLKAAGAQESK